MPEEVLESADPWLIALGIGDVDERDTPPHQHSRGQLMILDSGLMQIETDGGRWVIPPGRAVWIPPHCEHGARTLGRCGGMGVYITADAVEAGRGGLEGALRVIAPTPLLRELVGRAASWPVATPLEGAKEWLARLLLDELAEAAEEPLHLPLPRHAGLQSVARHIAGRPEQTEDLTAQARRAGLSVRSLTRQFRAETGLSLGEWRKRARLLSALERLAQGKSVTATALELGYDSLSAFIVMFRQELGETPSHFRRSVRP